jgi:non-specific serine/threonine protein kinase
LERIEARLDTGLALLSGGSRTAALRQQTLRATLDWSYDLLTDAERAMLRRAAVFTDGWNLEAAESICADAAIEANAVLALLTRLIDQSLIVHQPRGDDRGYRLLETIRHYGQERLREAAEETTLRRQHRDYFLELAEEAVPKLTGPEQVAWLDRLETEHANLRAALAWSVEQADAECALRLCGALQPFWAGRGYLEEGRKACAAALALPTRASVARTKALNTAGQLAGMQGDLATARVYLEEGLVMARAGGDREAVAALRISLGNVAHFSGDLDTAQDCFEESLQLEQARGNRVGIARAINNLGSIHNQRGEITQAMSCYEQSLAIARELGDQQGIARALHNLGTLSYVQARYPEARSSFEESLLLLQEIGDPISIATALSSLGNVS